MILRGQRPAVSKSERGNVRENTGGRKNNCLQVYSPTQREVRSHGGDTNCGRGGLKRFRILISYNRCGKKRGTKTYCDCWIKILSGAD